MELQGIHLMIIGDFSRRIFIDLNHATVAIVKEMGERCLLHASDNAKAEVENIPVGYIGWGFDVKSDMFDFHEINTVWDSTLNK